MKKLLFIFLKWFIGGFGFMCAIVLVMFISDKMGILDNKETSFYIPYKEGIEIVDTHLLDGTDEVVIIGKIKKDSTIQSEGVRLKANIFIDGKYADEVDDYIVFTNNNDYDFKIKSYLLKRDKIKGEISWEIKPIDFKVSKKVFKEYFKKKKTMIRSARKTEMHK
jgi:hypothetical protein